MLLENVTNSIMLHMDRRSKRLCAYVCVGVVGGRQEEREGEGGPASN